MKVAPHTTKCVYNGCKGTKMEYEGDGRIRCPKCKYACNYFMVGSLVLTFTFNKGFTKLVKAYHDANYSEDYEKLPSPKAVIGWNIHNGCQLYRLDLGKNIKFELNYGGSKKLDISLLEHLDVLYDVWHLVEIYVKEWAAGMVNPEGRA